MWPAVVVPGGPQVEEVVSIITNIIIHICIQVFAYVYICKYVHVHTNIYAYARIPMHMHRCARIPI